MLRGPPRSTLTYTLFPTRRSSYLLFHANASWQVSRVPPLWGSMDNTPTQRPFVSAGGEGQTTSADSTGGWGTLSAASATRSASAMSRYRNRLPVAFNKQIGRAHV